MLTFGATGTKLVDEGIISFAGQQGSGGPPPPPPPPPPSVTTAAFAEEVIRAVFDPITNGGALRVTIVSNVSNNHGTNLDWQQILNNVYDPTTKTIKVVIL